MTQTRIRRRRRSYYDFEIELDVRDSECDLQGVVNNAVYQNYFEHARRRYLITNGFDFARLREAVDTRTDVENAILAFWGRSRP